MKKYAIMTLALALAALTVQAQGPNNTGTYYKNADNQKGKALKTALCKIIKAPSVTSYDGLKEKYRLTDQRPDGKVRDRYSCVTNFTFNDFSGNYKDEGDMCNREHSFPKSWFGGKISPMYSDIVHVIPADGYINNRRGNYPFGENNGEKYRSSGNYSKLGTSTVSGYSGICFEPADEWKGDFARIYFYMVTCYEESIAKWSADMLNGTTYPGFSSWALRMLLEWAANDPVDDIERDRNEAAYSVQGNRNPFVDYPGLEQYIWGDYTTQPFSYDHYDAQPTIILPVQPQLSDEPEAVYTLDGRRLPTTLADAPRGIYVVKRGNRTRKVVK